MKILDRLDTLTLSSTPEMISELHWNSFLGACGFESSNERADESVEVILVQRKSKRHRVKVARISEIEIQITADEIRFSIARLLGCIGFHLHPRQSKDVAFEIYQVTFTDNLIQNLTSICNRIAFDTIGTSSDEIVERIFQICPNLLMPSKTFKRFDEVFAHFAILEGSQFLSLSSNRYSYPDWQNMDCFVEVRCLLNELGAKHLTFLIE